MTRRHIAIGRAVDVARTMPPLRHSLPGHPFDIERSEVARWLCSQPGIMQYVFDAAKNAGTIAYDPETGTWRGVDR